MTKPLRTALLAVLLAAAGLPARADEPSSSSLDVSVPPRHWSYRILQDLAEKGLVEGYPAFAFKGAQVFTRKELAQIVGAAIDASRRKGLDDDARDKLGRLTSEYGEEMALLGIDATLPARGPAAQPQPPAAPAPPSLTISGSNTLRQTAEEGKANDSFSDRIDLEVKLPNLRLRLQGQAENKPLQAQPIRETGDFRIDDRHSFDLTDRFLEIQGRFDDYAITTQVGTVDNLTFAEGLVLGATDVNTGGLVKVASPRYEVWSFYGETPRRNDLWGQRLLAKPRAGTELGVNFLRYEADKTHPAGRSIASVNGTTESRLPVLGTFTGGAEAAMREAGGDGLFARAKWAPGAFANIEGTYRNYRNFAFEFNSAPIYSGVSGGDDNDDLGGGAALTLNLPEWKTPGGGANMEMRFAYDRSRRHADAAGQNAAASLIEDFRGEGNLRLGPQTSLGYSYETELPRVTDPAKGARVTTKSTIQTARAAHTLPSGHALGLDATTDVDDQTAITTARGSWKIPIHKDIIALTLSDTFRLTHDKTGKEKDRDENDFQARMNWKVSRDGVLTIRGTVPSSNTNDPTHSSLDVTFILRF